MPATTIINPYESDSYLFEYLLFHYGSAEQFCPWPSVPQDALFFPVRVIKEILPRLTFSPKSRALDVGCAVGRSSFELTAFCAEVIGIDYSSRFIQTCLALKRQGNHRTYVVQQGKVTQETMVAVPPELDRSRVHFQTGDATALPEEMHGFDFVLAANLIDRLPSPRTFLNRLPSLVRTGGYVLITSPYTWMEAYTPLSEWLGGKADSPDTLQALEQILTPDFTLVQQMDMPFLIREHARKYQWSVAEATLWQRRG
jgi:putative 4-mercaptohistidine N1-methyltranferase